MTDDSNRPDGGADEVPLPPVPNSGQRQPQSTPRSRGGGGGDVPVKKTPIGKLILITILGMGVLFGIGYGLGQFFRSDSGSSASGGDSPEPCVTVTVTPSAMPPSQVTVSVLNATAPPGSAASTAEALQGAGFVIGTVANGTTDVTGVPAVIRYPAGSEAQAKTVQAYINGETKLQESPDSGGVELVLIQQFGGVADATTAQGKLSQPTPSPSGPGCSPTAAPASSASASATPSA